MVNYISKTQPKALSVSSSSFIFIDTFIHVGAIFCSIDCNVKNEKERKINSYLMHIDTQSS